MFNKSVGKVGIVIARHFLNYAVNDNPVELVYNRAGSKFWILRGNTMGTYGYYTGSMDIPEERREEFFRQVVKLANYGGMMDYERVSLYGYDMALLKPVEICREGRVYFDYNYFEDDIWETAGYDPSRTCFYSGKIEANTDDAMEQIQGLLRRNREEREQTDDAELAELAQFSLFLPARVIAYLTAEIKRLDFWKLWKEMHETVYHDEVLKQYAFEEKEWKSRREEHYL